MEATIEKKPFWSPEFRGSHRNGFNAEQEEALWNDSDPVHFRQVESPAHRRMAELAVQGFSQKEIAGLMGFNVNTVRDILCQPHARAHIVNAAKRPLQEELMEFLDAELMPSLQTMKGLRDDPTAKPSERLAAAKELADRRLGRPTQPFAQKDKAPCEMSMEELEAEVKEIIESNGRAKETSPAGLPTTP